MKKWNTCTTHHGLRRVRHGSHHDRLQSLHVRGILKIHAGIIRWNWTTIMTQLMNTYHRVRHGRRRSRRVRREHRPRPWVRHSQLRSTDRQSQSRSWPREQLWPPPGSRTRRSQILGRNARMSKEMSRNRTAPLTRVKIQTRGPWQHGIQRRSQSAAAACRCRRCMRGCAP